MKLKYFAKFFLIACLSVLVSGCIFSTESQQARSVAGDFWEAVIKKDMDSAKDLVTWDSSQFLPILANQGFAAQRYEVGEVKIDGTMAEVATVLYTGDKADIMVPVRTVLIRNKDKWQVDVQKTLGSLVGGAMSAVVGELNNFMQNGLQNLDKSMSESVNELQKSLQQGVEQLQKDLSKPAPIAPLPAPAQGSSI